MEGKKNTHVSTRFFLSIHCHACFVFGGGGDGGGNSSACACRGEKRTRSVLAAADLNELLDVENLGRHDGRCVVWLN